MFICLLNDWMGLVWFVFCHLNSRLSLPSVLVLFTDKPY